jgi:hypothetical protein
MLRTHGAVDVDGWIAVMAVRKRGAITVIIPDASPLLTLARVGRLDVFRHFVVPIQIVDLVKEEALRPVNDVTENVKRWFDTLPNNVEVVPLS